MWTPTHVQVTVHRARNLKAKGKNESNDAYVTISVGKEKYQTTIKERSKDPEWHEECDLPIPEENGVINLKAFHRNLLGIDEFLGYADIPLEEFKIYERPRSRWYALKNRPGSKKPEKYRGEIEVKVTFIVQSLSTSQLSLNKLDKVKRSTSIKTMVNQMGGKLNKLGPKGSLFRSGSKTDISDRGSDTLVSTPPGSVSDGSPTIHKVSKRDLNKSHDILPTSFNNYMEDESANRESDQASGSVDSDADQGNKDDDSKLFTPPFAPLRASRGRKSRLAKMHMLSQSTMAIPSQESSVGSRMKSCRAAETDVNEISQSMLDVASTTSLTPQSSPKEDKENRFSSEDIDSETKHSHTVETVIEEEENILANSQPAVDIIAPTTHAEPEKPTEELSHSTIVRPPVLENDVKDSDTSCSDVAEISSDKDSKASDLPMDTTSTNEEKSIPEQPDYEAPMLTRPKKPKRKIFEHETDRPLLNDSGVPDLAQPLSMLPEESSVTSEQASPEPCNEPLTLALIPPVSIVNDTTEAKDSSGVDSNKENDDVFTDLIEEKLKPRENGRKIKEPSRRHTLQYGINPKVPTHELHEGIIEYKSDQERNSVPKESSLPPDIVEQFKDYNRDDLVRIILEQRIHLKKKDATIKDLENYIDNLLVRVMESTPKILQSEDEMDNFGLSPMRNLSNTNMKQNGKHISLATTPSVKMMNYNAQQRNLNVQINFNNSNSSPNIGRSGTKEKKPPFSLFKKDR